jgi:5-methylcytosine-specific restriction endonuclease McrA
VDHVKPRHQGGEHVWSNVVAACPPCNHRKGSHNLDEVHMHLLHPPKEPPASAVYLFGRHIVEYGEWEPYIMGW